MKHDAVIVGASIAGLSMGNCLAGAGWNVVIFDRRRQIGLPVRCGEATGNRAELSRFITVDESWIACSIEGIVAHVNGSPGIKRPIPQSGVILHRDRFEQKLAHMAVSAGAQVRVSTVVTGLFREGGQWAGVTLENGERVEAAIIIGADGAESYVGRWAGMTAPLRLDEIASTIQYQFRSDFCNDGFLHFFIGEQAIPSGYLWVFPKGNGLISVGGGMYRCARGLPKVRHFVDRFIEEHLRGAELTPGSLITGSIPVTIASRKLVKENVVLVGDSARQVNPLTAGGIMNALEAADSAAKYLIARQASTPRKLTDTYSRDWYKNQRRQHKLFMLLREIWFSTPDTKLLSSLQTVFSLTDFTLDRSKPFTLPLVPLFRFLMHVLPLTLKHIWILFK